MRLTVAPEPSWAECDGGFLSRSSALGFHIASYSCDIAARARSASLLVVTGTPRYIGRASERANLPEGRTTTLSAYVLKVPILSKPLLSCRSQASQ